MGLLVVRGSLRVSQFWPRGGADADTATIQVVLAGSKAFTYVSDTGQRKPTRVFENAEVVGRQGPQRVIKHDAKLNADKINVRLQGLDAPELHFQPTVKGSQGKNGKFRQSLGETCSHALLHYLSKLGLNEIPCEVLTRVRLPADVCDVYGRVVGNVVVAVDGTRVDLNHWLIREGWALPGLYNSMTKNEVRQVQADHAAAVQGKRGMFRGKHVTGTLAAFDKTRRYRKGPDSFKPFSDKGAVNFPKFFRRQADHAVRRAVGTPHTPPAFLAYVASKPDDIAIALTAFLKRKGSTSSPDFKKQFTRLATFVKSHRYPTGENVIFWEANAKFVKAGTKKPITSW